MTIHAYINVYVSMWYLNTNFPTGHRHNCFREHWCTYVRLHVAGIQEFKKC